MSWAAEQKVKRTQNEDFVCHLIQNFSYKYKGNLNKSVSKLENPNGKLTKRNLNCNQN